MKQAILILASFLFSILFFEKSIGLNLSIFSICTIGILIAHNPKIFRHKSLIFLSFTYALTAVVVFVQGSSLSIIANCIVFFTLVGATSQQHTSVYVTWLNGLYSTIAGFFHRNFEVNETDEKVKIKKDIDVLHLVKLIGIPLIFIITFTLLYKNGNPMFSDFISKIDFSFINLQWLLFTVLGYFLFQNISKPVRVEPATSQDQNTSNDLRPPNHISEEKLRKEKQIGTTLLMLLNTLLVFYIVTDITYLFTAEITRASELSNQVHTGINTLIASIVIAILIILYYFRGDLNFYSKNRNLKRLTYLWIILNISLIVLIAIKNHNYITAFGLTYKRIGVHVYLFLALVGLVTTFFKVLQLKNLAYLFRMNTKIAFAVLVISSALNWDKLITDYNINVAESFDIHYLLNLSNRNANLLYHYKDKMDIPESTKNRIATKYRNNLREHLQYDWQEYSLETFQLESQQQTTTAP
ncbi:DUF4153 domain-containing protein [Psychroserpens sp. BH13MA-6]